MKKFSRFVTGAALLALPILASARPAPVPRISPLAMSAVDVYFIPQSKFEIKDPVLGDAEDDGDGFGVKGLFRLGSNAAFIAEYQSVTLDETEADLDQLRLGGGWVATGTSSGIFGEYNKFDLTVGGVTATLKGGSVHGRLAAPIAPKVELYGDIGYLMLQDEVAEEDFSGFEFTIGGVLRFTRNFSTFIDYRLSNLDSEDSDFDQQLSDVRVGARFNF